MSTLGVSVLAVGFIIPTCYFLWSLKYGKIAGSNPWGAVGLEWNIESPPDPHNFHEVPIVTWEAYEYTPEQALEAELDRESMPGTPERAEV
jgi:cytochrome c oxidase subunit 1